MSEGNGGIFVSPTCMFFAYNVISAKYGTFGSGVPQLLLIDGHWLNPQTKTVFDDKFQIYIHPSMVALGRLQFWRKSTEFPKT